VNDIPLSLRDCISNIGKPLDRVKKDQHIRDFKKAARNTINIQIQKFRLSNPLPTYYEMQVDHNNLFFTQLLEQWIIANNIKIGNVKVIQGSCSDGFRFSNQNIAQSWADYHEKHATLQWLSKADNIAKQPPRTKWLNYY